MINKTNIYVCIYRLQLCKEKKGLLKAARAMKKRGKMTDSEIAADLDLTEAEVADIKID